jgi:hypothetical protein
MNTEIKFKCLELAIKSEKGFDPKNIVNIAKMFEQYVTEPRDRSSDKTVSASEPATVESVGLVGELAMPPHFQNLDKCIWDKEKMPILSEFPNPETTNEL